LENQNWHFAAHLYWPGAVMVTILVLWNKDRDPLSLWHQILVHIYLHLHVFSSLSAWFAQCTGQHRDCFILALCLIDVPKFVCRLGSSTWDMLGIQRHCGIGLNHILKTMRCLLLCIFSCTTSQISLMNLFIIYCKLMPSDSWKC